MSILKGGILAMLQSTLTTSSPSSLKNNLQPPYELRSFFSLPSAQLQSWIWTPYIKTSYRLFLVTQLLQNTSPQMAGGLQTQTVYSSLTTEFMYHLLVTSAHMFSSTIMIISLLDILVKTKTRISLPWILLAQSLCWCTTILQVLCHLYAIQATTLQALQISQTTSYFQTTMEFHFYRLHWETSIILQIWHYLGHSQPAHQTGNLYPCP